MPFFDSPKNRAMWERKLSGLRQEKVRRKEAGYVPRESGVHGQTGKDNPYRKRITLKQLEERVERKEKVQIRRTRLPGRQAEISKKKEGRQI